MKKVFYISAIVLGLGFVSCQKQEVTPAQELDAPVWQDAGDSDENARSANTNGGLDLRVGADDTGMPTDNGSGTVNDGGITDPNTDPDADNPDPDNPNQN